jgi:hypothetical protein
MNRRKPILVAIGLAISLVGCADYSGEARQLRAACSTGDQSACIDYDAMVKSCIAPMGLFPQMGCEGVGPATVYHPDGTFTPPARRANAIAVGSGQAAPTAQAASTGPTTPAAAVHSNVAATMPAGAVQAHNSAANF